MLLPCGNKFSLMDIKLASVKEVEWLDGVIRSEFPYTGFSLFDISHKIKDSNYLVFCGFEKKKPIAFAELQFFSADNSARLSAVFVEKKFRRKGFATKLAKKLFVECKKRKCSHVFLLVKEGNKTAKAFYKKIGFAFEKEHDKIIEGSKVEVWSIEI